MLFNSYQFLLFFPIVTLIYFLLPHRLRWFHLLMASFLFYMAFLPIYVLILVVTIVIDYFAGIYIEQAQGRRRKQYLIISLIANIGFLCFFKYYDFIITNLNDVLPFHVPILKELWISSQIIEGNNVINTALNSWLGTDLDILQTIILPIGLSFHTFQAMSYTIEVYRGNQKAERHFGIYALYVMFYPQLVAGPIERPQNILHQFHERKHFSAENLIVGLRLMAWGLFKKVVIADRLSIYVNLVYGDPENYHWLNLVIATIYFAIQIYCDFSGYSDIAIGAARVMGFDLMVNFRRPYFATNIKEFWEKWHISLSTWFRDYLYKPLGGNRVAFARYLLNIAIVFMVSGIWHGANWTFIIWGALHAVYQVSFILFNRYATEKDMQRSNWAWRAGGWLLTFVCVCFAWIFFRAQNVGQAFTIINQIVTLYAPTAFNWMLMESNNRTGFGITSLVLVVLGCTYMFWIEKKNQPLLTEYNNKPMRDIAMLAFLVFAIITVGVFVNESFIYFQF